VNGGLVGQQRRWNNGANDVLDDLLADEGLLGFFGAVLSDHVLVLDSDDDVVGVERLAVLSVHERDLGFGVRSSPRKRTVQTEFAHLTGQGLGKGDGKRHPTALVFGVGLRFVTGVAEHQSLVACTLVVNGLHHAAVDVGGLAGDEFCHIAQILGGGIHADAVGGVTDGSSRLSSDGDVIRSVDACSELDLSSEHDVGAVFTAFYERLNGDLGFGVERKTRIDDSVRDCIAQFVWMTCGNRF